MTSAAQGSRPVESFEHRPAPPGGGLPGASVTGEPVRQASGDELARLGSGAAAARGVVALLSVGGTLVGELVVGRAADEPAFDAADLALIDELAASAGLAIEAARLYDERGKLAATLQAALLPPPLPTTTGVRFAARYRTAQEATEIGGDFYDVHLTSPGCGVLALGDVCGKGVEAAVLAGRARQSLQTAALVEPSPAGVLDLLNRAMIQADGTRFVTLVHGRFATAADGSVRLTLAGGGHPSPMVARRDGSVDVVDTGGTLVGMLAEARFRDTEIVLAPGEVCLLYTDGVTEARVGTEQLGTERLRAMLTGLWGMPAPAVAERVEHLALEFLGGRPHDDIALLAIQADPEEGIDG